MKELPKFFEFDKRKEEIHKKWDELDVYKYDPNDSNTFSIDTPPPTVSGHLHMGHVFSYVQADIIARYNRIAGKNVFYPIGFDDNGLPTERLVEKQTGKKVGINCTKGEFQTECFKVVQEVEDKFEKLFRSIGISYDWSLKYQTISKETEKIVLESFADLNSKGLVYLKDAPVYWDTEDKTALAQADLEEKELDGAQYIIPFTCPKSGKSVEVMTTRPELLVSCVAVLHHPEDKRFEGITSLKTPFFNEEVPFIAEETVKKEKGTGVVMCCSYGDWSDVEWIQKHSLSPKVLIQPNGEITHEFYKNHDTGRHLRTVNARIKIVQNLKDHGLILKETKVKHTVKCGERSGKPVEIINQRQVYIKTLPFKEILLKATKDINFTPPYMKARLQQWIEGLNQDWCISRNRFFGIEIPYHTTQHNGKVYEIIFPNGVYNSPELSDVKKTDFGYTAVYNGEIEELKSKNIELKFHYVFDTWFTSSLTPQIAQKSLKPYNLPLSLRPQAHEIIRTWTFYTLLKSILHASNTSGNGTEIANVNGKMFHVEHSFIQNNHHIPWKNVALSGWCLASDKSKMSKSKGNAVDPLSLIQKHGADVVRLWCSNTPLGTDSAYSEDRMDFGRKFTVKLWNTVKFALQTKLPEKHSASDITCEVDLWAISELKKAICEYKMYMEKTDYFHARKTLDIFFWNVFCDNYIEFVKFRYREGAKDSNPDELKTKITEKTQTSAVVTTYTILSGIATLYAPFCPFICEEIHHILFKNIESVNRRGSLISYESIISNIKTDSCGNHQTWMDIVLQFRKHKANKTLSEFNATYGTGLNRAPLDIKTYINQNS